MIQGDATDLPLLKSERIGLARTFVALSGHDENNLMACMLAKSPEDRPATPAEAAAALEPFCDGGNLPALVSQMDVEPEVEIHAASQAEIAMML